jgi:hypothetical protein
VILDVSREDDVNQAASFVEKQISDRKLGGLYGVLQCAGIAFTAPFEVERKKSFCFSFFDFSIEFFGSVEKYPFYFDFF